MDNNNDTTFILLTGIFIVGVFISVSTFNILPNNIDSDPMYSQNESNINFKVIDTNFNNDRLNVITDGNSKRICVKTTKSKPSKNDFCWKNIDDNKFSISVYKNKTYYIWLTDNKNISNFVIVKY